MCIQCVFNDIGAVDVPLSSVSELPEDFDQYQ